VRAHFVPNANYWGEKGKVDIEYRYITDTAVAFEAYKNDELDITQSAAEDLAVIDADPNLKAQHLVYPGSCTIAIMFHNLKEPFTDKKVREAFSYALDREAWVKDVDGGLSLPTLTWIPKGYPGYKEGETRWGFDPEKAKQALAESSYGGPDALNALGLQLTFGDNPRDRTRFEWLAAQYKQYLGVDLELNPVEPTAYTALTKDVNTSPILFRLGWCADYPDPQNWLSVYWKTGGFGERIGYSNPELDTILNEADTTSDAAKRMELYQQAQDLFIDDAAVAMDYNTINHYLVKPWVKGVQMTPQDTDWPGSYLPWTIEIDTAAKP
jgi:oligopeptide transport system substrate-binding protein